MGDSFVSPELITEALDFFQLPWVHRELAQGNASGRNALRQYESAVCIP